jgi:hypothetical protein
MKKYNDVGMEWTRIAGTVWSWLEADSPVWLVRLHWHRAGSG